jgi:hypothetical protein
LSTYRLQVLNDTRAKIVATNYGAVVLVPTPVGATHDWFFFVHIVQSYNRTIVISAVCSFFLFGRQFQYPAYTVLVPVLVHAKVDMGCDVVSDN